MDSSSSPTRRSSLFAAGRALLGDRGSAELEKFDVEENRILVRGGELLFAEGDDPDALFIVVRGSLEVFVRDARSDRGHRVLDIVGRGGFVGEMALLGARDDKRSATVRALRDSELVKISKTEFDRLVTEHPEMAMQLARVLVMRLRAQNTARRPPRRVSTVCLLPLPGRRVPDDDFAVPLLAALHEIDAHGAPRADGTRPRPSVRLDGSDADREVFPGASALETGAPRERELLAWLAREEDDRARVVFDCDADGAAWNARALRQAELILVVVAADEPVEDLVDALAIADRVEAYGRRELVLLHPAESPSPSGTGRWLGASRFSAHHHVRLGNRDDIARLARAIAGQSYGLVLGGGGARGFAHIGVIRAMLRAGYPIDVIGGTSMGAIIAAMYAIHAWRERTPEQVDAELRRLVRQHYVQEGAVPDRTLPIVALSSGRNTRRKLQAMFGTRAIEDLPIRYFNVSCNISRAESTVHDHGSLWLWTRASCAIPGLAPPIVVDGDLHCDGGILDNVPTTAMRERCQGEIFACDVSLPVDLQTDTAYTDVVNGVPVLMERFRMKQPQRPYPSIVEILGRTAMVASVRDGQDAQREADLLIRPPLDGFGMAAVQALDEIADRGFDEAEQQFAAWKVGPARTHSGARR